ncbi:non-homologous end-joining DNA ligase [Streptomyces sp. NPDC007083]|uniref:non-homologous end-joining DNA ligase n=1 Tax=unclassified Streptomyces TaxID=2593676 RepID=UPI0034032184
MRLTFGSYVVDVSNEDKLFFPDDGITKGQLVRYYADVAPTLLRHAAGRPVAMKRYPDGITAQAFFQKRAGDHFPDWLDCLEVPLRSDGTANHVILHRAADLAYLADQGCVTPHLWLSTAARLDHPDRLVFDLDPSTTDLAPVRTAAHAVHDLLADVGLPAYAMTSGSRGYHVYVPLDGSADFDTARDFAHHVAEAATARHPGTLTTAQRKDQRGDRVLIDYLRNAYGQTSAAPYAVRARPSAPVATPLEWSELDTTDPRDHTLTSLPDRLEHRGDPWSGMAAHARSLTEPARRLAKLCEE